MSKVDSPVVTTRSNPLIVAACVVGAIAAASAGCCLVLAAVDGGALLANGVQQLDLCGQQVSGFWAAWAHFSWAAEALFGLLIVANVVGLWFVVMHGARPRLALASTLMVSALALSAAPWVVNHERGVNDPGCHQL